MLKNMAVLLLLLFVMGCATMPAMPDTETTLRNMYNISSSGVSQFDGTKYIRISNMACTTEVMFALYQDTAKSKKGIVLLQAGSNSITNIGNGKSLHIKLDGKTYSFSSNDAVTEYATVPIAYGGTFNYSHKTFVIPEAIVRKAAASEEFLAKLYLLNNTYIEGKCSPITLQEAKEINNQINKQYNVNITQEYIDTVNKYSAIEGFREFVKMMDSTSW